MLLNLGRKEDMCCDVAPGKPKKQSRTYYPSSYVHGLKGKISIDSSMLNKDIALTGGVIRITGLDVRTTEKGEETSIDFEIRQLEFGKKKKAADGESFQDAIQEALEGED